MSTPQRFGFRFEASDRWQEFSDYIESNYLTGFYDLGLGARANEVVFYGYSVDPLRRWLLESAGVLGLRLLGFEQNDLSEEEIREYEEEVGELSIQPYPQDPTADDLPELLARLEGSDRDDRIVAAAQIGELPPDVGAAAIPALRRLLEEGQWEEQAHAAGVLAKFDSEFSDRAVEVARRLLSEVSSRLEMRVFQNEIAFTSWFEPAKFRAESETLLRHDDPWVRMGAVSLIECMPASDSLIHALVRVLTDDSDASVREAAASVLGEKGSATKAVESALRDALNDSDRCVRDAASMALKAISGDSP